METRSASLAGPDTPCEFFAVRLSHWSHRQMDQAAADRRFRLAGRAHSGAGLWTVAPRFAPGGGPGRTCLDLGVACKLEGPPQHFPPDLNGGATSSPIQEAGTAANLPVR